MASARDVEARPRDDPAYSLQRDYQDGHTSCHRESAAYRHEPGRRAAGASRAGPPGWLRDQPHTVEQDQAGAECRPSAECGSEADSGARRGNQALREQALLQGDGPLPPHRLGQDTGRGAEPPLRHGRRSGGFPEEPRGGERLPHSEDREQTCAPQSGAALHDEHPAAGGQPEAGLQRGAHDAGGAAAVRERIHHVYAYRQCEPQPAGLRDGEAGDSGAVRCRICEDPPLPDQDQGGAGGPRGHTPHGPHGADHQRRERAAPPLRAHLEADGGQPDGRRGDREDGDRDRLGAAERRERAHGVPVQRRAGEVRRLPEGIHGEQRRGGRQPDGAHAAAPARRDAPEP